MEIEGLTTAEIGKLVGITKNGVVGKALDEPLAVARGMAACVAKTPRPVAKSPVKPDAPISGRGACCRPFLGHERRRIRSTAAARPSCEQALTSIHSGGRRHGSQHRPPGFERGSRHARAFQPISKARRRRRSIVAAIDHLKLFTSTSKA